MMVPCSECDTEFVAQRSTARFCSESCKKRAKRGRARAEGQASKVGALASVTSLRGAGAPVPRQTVSIESRVVRELGPQLDSALGQQCLLIAQRLDDRLDLSGSAVAALSKRLEAMLETVAAIRAAKATTADVEDPLDFLARRAEERRQRGA